jgi:thiosulfate oxidation carrier protein SoxY
MKAGEAIAEQDLRRAAALGLGGAVAASTIPAQARADDPDIVDLPPWSTSLGSPVAATPYGMPSRYERNLVRRQSPGLTQVGAASVAFTPLQGHFGIITPSGLHFERHHQGWMDIDPKRHRFMINGSLPGMVARPMVFTIDDLMRLPSVSRMHFLECGANTGIMSRPRDGVRYRIAALLVVACASLAAATALATGHFPGIGRPATEREIAAWDIDVRPDFLGLPKGAGTVEQGQEIWAAKCASCHGIFGESNQIFTPLIGGTTAADIESGRVANPRRVDYPRRTRCGRAAVCPARIRRRGRGRPVGGTDTQRRRGCLGHSGDAGPGGRLRCRRAQDRGMDSRRRAGTVTRRVDETGQPREMGMGEMNRRQALRAGGLFTAFVAAGLLPAGWARAAWNKAAFEGKSIQEALGALGATAPGDSDAVQIIASDIAENGAVVPVQIVSRVPGTTQIVLFVEKNPNVLAGVFNVGPDIAADVTTRIKMMQTSNVVAVVKADGKFLAATKEIKVTLGGCGG